MHLSLLNYQAIFIVVVRYCCVVVAVVFVSDDDSVNSNSNHVGIT